MWRFSLFGFPVTVEPWFWLTSFLLGGGLTMRGRDGLAFVAIWMVVVLVSILVHEFGHAFAGRRYGALPEIRLHGFGGVAIMHGGYFDRPQSILVSAAGPAASFALGVVVWLVSKVWLLEEGFPLLTLQFLLYVNFFWTVINLLPILPLDGGQIIRDVMGPRRLQLVVWIGVVCAGAVALWAFSVGRTFLGIMMIILAFSNYQSQNIQGGVVRD
jgi:Zn-dependent protease